MRFLSVNNSLTFGCLLRLISGVGSPLKWNTLNIDSLHSAGGPGLAVKL